MRRKVIDHQLPSTAKRDKRERGPASERRASDAQAAAFGLRCLRPATLTTEQLVEYIQRQIDQQAVIFGDLEPIDDLNIAPGKLCRVMRKRTPMWFWEENSLHSCMQ